MATYGNMPVFNSIDPITGTRTLSNGNQTFAGTNATPSNCPLTFGATSGKFYGEISFNSATARDNVYWGVASTNWADWQTSSYQLGASAESAGIWINTGPTYNTKEEGNTTRDWSLTPDINDRMIAAFDADTGNVWIGIWDNSASASKWIDSGGTVRSTDEPGLNRNPTSNWGAGESKTFGCSNRLFDSVNGTSVLHMHDTDWSGTVPDGFTSLATQNLPKPAVINPDEHFFTTVVDHDGSSTATTCGFNLETNEWLAIIKNTTGADENWYMIDSLRGVTKVVTMNTNAAETTDSNVLTVSGTTFTLGSTLSDKDYYVEIHKAGLTSAKASNTEGSLNTTATSANLVSGFSISTYVGSGANTNYGHGLNSAPEWTITKLRVGADQGNYAWHVGLGDGTKLIYPHLTNAIDTAASIWNSTVPSATLNSLGNAVGTNTNTYTYVNWSWHSVEGYSKMGKWVANGDADGPFINLGGSPQSMIIRDYVGLANWEIFSTAMSPTNPMVNEIFPNTAGDIGTNGGIDFTSTGIKVLNTGDPNNSGRSYIYGAFGLRALTDGGINQGRAK